MAAFSVECKAKSNNPRVMKFGSSQRYTYRVLQTIQMKFILLCVWAERPFCAVHLLVFFDRESSNDP